MARRTNSSRTAPKAFTQSKKRLFVCCDGTWNDSIKDNNENHTNVAKFGRCIAPVDKHGVHQIVYYHKGPLNGPTGGDIHDIIREAYYFLCLNYKVHHNNNTKDEIHLVGFSRGAFAVRALACFINDVGLTRKRFLPLFPNLYNSWRLAKRYEDLIPCQETQNEEESTPIEKESGPVKSGPIKEESESIEEESEQIEDEFKDLIDEFAKEDMVDKNIIINSCAVWDTVSALNNGINNPMEWLWKGKVMHPSSRLKWVGDEVPSCVEYAFQALALNEGSNEYLPVLWRPNPQSEKRVDQCWFRGNHSDIGGGHADCGLANLAFLWMVGRYKSRFPELTFEHDVLTNIMTPMYLKYITNRPAWAWEWLANTSKVLERMLASKLQVQENVHLKPGQPVPGEMHKDSVVSKDKGISGPKTRKKFFEYCPTIHFSVPIYRQLESEDERSKHDPLLQGLEQLTREKDGSGDFTWRQDSTVAYKEFCSENWEKANFMAWLIRERKYQYRLKKDGGENNGGFLEQTALASKFHLKLLVGFPNKTADEFKKCTELRNKDIQPNISGKSDKSDTGTKSASELVKMFNNMLNDYWNNRKKERKRNNCDENSLSVIPEQPDLKEPDLTSDTRTGQPSPQRKSSATGGKKRTSTTSEPSQTPLSGPEISSEWKARRKPGKPGHKRKSGSSIRVHSR